MDFNNFQKLALKSATYPNRGNNLVYPMLGLAGETGEVSEKLKKMFRDNQGILTDEIKESIKLELGDVLWYVAALAFELKLDLDDVAVSNIEKLTSRLARNKIHGNGDNR